MDWARIIRGLGGVTIVFLSLLAFTPVTNMVGSAIAVSRSLQPCDAIVVLAAGTLKDGELDDESMRRVVHGLELYKRGFAPLIVLSGSPSSSAPVPTEAETRYKLASDIGIPSSAIIKMETANTTREESAGIGRLLLQRNAGRILLVTESLHMRRARLVFERAGLKVSPAPSDDYSKAANSARDRLWLATRILQESAALVYYRAAGYL